MSQLRDRMIEDLRLRGQADNTIKTYVRCVRKFFEWAGVVPSKVDAEQRHENRWAKQQAI